MITSAPRAARDRSHSRSAPALIARERVLTTRRGVHLFHLLRERWRVLTLMQIRRMSRLLTDHADALYRRADRVERGAVVTRLTKDLSLAALASRIDQVGQGDDPVTRSTVDRLVELSATIEGRATTPAAIRAVAIEVVRLAETVTGARDLPRWKPPPRLRSVDLTDESRDGPLKLAVAASIGSAPISPVSACGSTIRTPAPVGAAKTRFAGAVVIEVHCERPFTIARQSRNQISYFQ